VPVRGFAGLPAGLTTTWNRSTHAGNGARCPRRPAVDEAATGPLRRCGTWPRWACPVEEMDEALLRFFASTFHVHLWRYPTVARPAAPDAGRATRLPHRWWVRVATASGPSSRAVLGDRDRPLRPRLGEGPPLGLRRGCCVRGAGCRSHVVRLKNATDTRASSGGWLKPVPASTAPGIRIAYVGPDSIHYRNVHGVPTASARPTPPSTLDPYGDAAPISPPSASEALIASVLDAVSDCQPVPSEPGGAQGFDRGSGTWRPVPSGQQQRPSLFRWLPTTVPAGGQPPRDLAPA